MRDTCARSKSNRHLPFGLLHSLPIPNRPWGSVALDFIVGLPPSYGFTAILVVTDRLLKGAHFIPCTEETSADDTARLYAKEIFKHHGAPDDIISDRGPQFVSKFWKEFWRLLGVKVNLSTSFHPQSDPTERVNQVLEQYLRCFCNDRQDDWVDLLCFAEFSYNNTINASSKFSYFYAYTGNNPRFDFLPSSTTSNPAVADKIQQIKEVQEQLKKNLEQAQNNAKIFSDRRRIEAPKYLPGDLVWLRKTNIKTTRPCNKLDFKKLGPFPIHSQINDVVYRLNLPVSMKIHNSFHVSLLEPYRSNMIPNRSTPVPTPVSVSTPDVYLVDDIIDSRRVGRGRGNLQYLIHWKGFQATDRTWEPKKNILGSGVQRLIREFHKNYPTKPI